MVLPTGAGLSETIARHKVSSAWLTAALFNAIVDENASHLAGLKELLIGGEAYQIRAIARPLVIQGRRAGSSDPKDDRIPGDGSLALRVTIGCLVNRESAIDDVVRSQMGQVAIPCFARGI